MALMFLSRRLNKKSIVPLSHVACTTLAPGNIVPISITRIVAGDKVKFKPSSFVQAMPMKAPLVNGFKICYEYFFVPDRLYNKDLLLNIKGSTYDPDEVKFPVVTESLNTYFSTYGAGLTDLLKVKDSDAYVLPTVDQVRDLAEVTVAPGSLANYVGFPAGYTSMAASTVEAKTNHSALKALGYLDIYYNYYVNNQIDDFPTAYFDLKTQVPGLGAPFLERPYRKTVAELELFLNSLKVASAPDEFIKSWIESMTTKGQLLPEILMSWEFLCSRRSIFQRCLKPYYLEAWMKTAGILEDSVEVVVDSDFTTFNNVKFKNIRDASHIERWLQLAISGDGTYADYLNAEFDVGRIKNTTVPVFLGADRHMLGSRTIYQTTGAADPSSPLGAFAGQASDGSQFKKRSFSFDENGYFFVMASIVPDTIYYRGLDPFLQERTLGDMYAPALDNMSMEPLMRSQLDALPVMTTNGSSATGFGIRLESRYAQGEDVALGYVPAWSRYTQNVSKAYGRMTTDLKYWLLAREYAAEPDSGALTFFRELVAAYSLNDGSNTFLSKDDAEAVYALLENVRLASNPDPYILANMYNDVFADISNQAQNFVLSFSCDMSALRQKSKVNIPNTL